MTRVVDNGIFEAKSDGQPLALAPFAAASGAAEGFPEFDTGPLSWVQGEIAQSLERGLQSLEAYVANPPDTASLKHARNHIHQASGAIQMVGLDAVAVYADEIERQLARLDDVKPDDLAAACAVIDRACRKLDIFLDDLVGGAPPVPLQLFPEYDAMQRARGVREATPTDLFYPELDLRMPALEAIDPLPVGKLASHLVRTRRSYQRSLLAFLRGDAAAARGMREAVAAVEKASSRQGARVFWWTVGAFFDAIVDGSLEAGFGAKQLAARIDLQMRRVAEGSAKVADRLRREVLYYVAISKPVSKSVRAVQRSFHLTALVPSPEAFSADLVRLQPILREVREQLAAAKDLWLKVTTGRVDSLQRLKHVLASVRASAAEIRNAAFAKLVSSLAARLDAMPSSGHVPEALAMEYATGLLLAESAIENHGKLEKEFPKQVDAMLSRLDAAQAGQPIPEATAPILDEMFRRAHERLLLSQVAREIQVNLRHMEQVLDAFFRDHAKRADLATLGKDSRQIRGALTMLGEDDAERLLGLCQEQIDSYADPETQIDGEDLELLAESLSGLGFFIEAFEQRRPDRERLIAPLLAKRLGEAPAPVVDRHAETVEHAVEELRSALPALLAEVHRAPADAEARALLKTRLDELVDDAKLIDDEELVAQAEAARAQLESGAAADLEAAVSAIAASGAAVAAPAPEISAETQRLLATDAQGLDAELLEIYLTEAAEVLDTIAADRRELVKHPGDREVLRSVRRQFHTLKGSGRMVGLTELGEIAWDVERIHNRLLEEDRPLTPAVLAMIEVGERNFRAWISALKDEGRVTADPAELYAAIEAVEAELPADRERVHRAPAPAVVQAPAPAVVQAPAPAAVPALPELDVPPVEALASAVPPPQGIEVGAPAAELELMAAEEGPPAEALPKIELVDVAPAEAASAEEELVLPELGAPAPVAAEGVVAEEVATEELAEEVAPPQLGAPVVEPDEAEVIAVAAAPSMEMPDAAGDALPELGASLARSPEIQDVHGGIDTSVELSELARPEALAAEASLSQLDRIEMPEPVEALDETTIGFAPAAADRELADRAAAPEEAPAPAMALGAIDDDDFEELPEVGGASHDAAAPAAVSIDEPPLPEDAGSDFLEFRSVDTTAAPHYGDEEKPDAADEAAPDGVALSDDLHDVLVDEADVHLASLAHELSLLQFDPHALPSEAMVRASHTLCGIHRTSGLAPIASTAGALEECLLRLRQGSAPLPDAALPIIANAVHGLRELVGRVRGRVEFDAADSVAADEMQQELNSLRPLEIEAADFDADVAHDLAFDEADIESAIAESLKSLEAEAFAPEPINLAFEKAAEPAQPVTEPAVGEMPAAHEAGAPQAGASPSIEHEQAEERVEAPTPISVPMEFAAAVQRSSAPAHPHEIAPSGAVEDPLANIRDDVDEQVLPIFLEEAAELYPQAGEQVRAWRRMPNDFSAARQLRRTLHTLKGSARMAGAMRLGELAHLMESRISTGDELTAGTPELFEELDADLDRLAHVLDALREGRTNVLLPGVAAAASPAAIGGARGSKEAAPAASGDRQVVVPLTAASPGRRITDAVEADAGARAMLRVRADVIDRLVNEVGEVAITRARIESELKSLKANLLELTTSVVRLRSQVREMDIQSESQIQSRLMQVGENEEGFDPLEFDRYTRFQELARSLSEGVNDVSTIQQSLLRNLDVTDTALVSQARLTRDVQQQLFGIRTVPFGSLSERLYRILRGTAKELDKRANLEIRGAATELDRSVLEKLVGPLDHLLRNALDHGIEPRSVRAKAGKSETGEISLEARHVGNEIAIELTDDGAGLNLERIRSKAIAQGRFGADAHPTDDQLVSCIFEPGFSTAAKVTQVSGRGIGMDVVRAEIAELGGRVEVSTRVGSGTTFRLYLPLTLAVAQAVLVRAGGRLWALPAPMVEKVEQMKPEQLVELYVQRRMEWQGTSYPFHYLPRLLGDQEHVPESTRNNAVLLLRSGQSVAAIHVDEMVGNQEVVVKNIGPQLARVSGIAGATVLGNGEIVLIINPVQLAQRADVPVFEPNAERIAPEVPRMTVVQQGRPLVMIVDDSLTVRRITSRLLQREGFDVLTAKDGLDALDLLSTEAPDVILLDIEMPRMDGFEFTKKIKADPEKAGIPIVMITSRTAEKHRNLAAELGVELYLGKPFQEQELLKNLREMLALAS